MYGTVGAVYLLSTTMMGLAVGPYLMGKIAMISGSLSVGVMSMLVATPIALVALGLLSRRTADAEATKDVRALEAELRRARLGGGKA
jgi:ABC-type phosphate transport system permease subunit